MRALYITGIILLACFSGISGTPAGDSIGKRQNNFHFDLTGGYSIATGKYSSHDKSEEKAGFAANGFYLQFSGTWRGKGVAGLGFSYVYQQNPLQKNVDTIPPLGFHIPIGTKPWTNHYLLAGLSIRKDFKRFFIEAKILGGFLISNSNHFGMKVLTDTLGNTTETMGPGTGFGYQVLAGAGFKFNPKWSVHLNVNYLGGTATRRKSFSSYMYDKELEKYVFQVVEYEVKKPVSTIQIGVGIVYTL